MNNTTGTEDAVERREPDANENPYRRKARLGKPSEDAVEVIQADRDAAEVAHNGAINAARALSSRECGALESELREASKQYLAGFLARHRIAHQHQPAKPSEDAVHIAIKAFVSKACELDEGDEEAWNYLLKGERKESKIFRECIAAALSTKEAVRPSDVEALEDCQTHRYAWRRAIEIAREHAVASPPDVDCKAYWSHELKAFDRTFDALQSSTTVEPRSADCTKCKVKSGFKCDDCFAAEGGKL